MSKRDDVLECLYPHHNQAMVMTLKEIARRDCSYCTKDYCEGDMCLRASAQEALACLEKIYIEHYAPDWSNA